MLEDETLRGWLGPSPVLKGRTSGTGNWPGFTTEAEGGAPGNPGSQWESDACDGGWKLGGAGSREGVVCRGSHCPCSPTPRTAANKGVLASEQTRAGTHQGHFCCMGPGDGADEALLRMSHFYDNLNEVRFNVQIRLPW